MLLWFNKTIWLASIKNNKVFFVHGAKIEIQVKRVTVKNLLDKLEIWKKDYNLRMC